MLSRTRDAPNQMRTEKGTGTRQLRREMKSFSDKYRYEFLKKSVIIYLILNNKYV